MGQVKAVSCKGSLAQLLENHAKRLSAHTSNVVYVKHSLDFTPTSRKQTEVQIENADVQEAARWKDNYGSQRLSAAIFDLINADNVRSRKIAEKIDVGALEVALGY